MAETTTEDKRARRQAEIDAVGNQRPFQLALTEIKGRAEADGVGRGFEVAANVADKILTAETLDDILNAPEQGPGDLSDFVGKSFRIIGGTIAWAPSSEQFREGGTGYYVQFKALDMNGQEVFVSTGSVNVVFQIKAMEKMGLFDEEGVPLDRYLTVRSRPVPSGTLYWLGSA